MISQSVDFRDDDRIIKQASGLVRSAIGVPPVARWRHDGMPRILIESYLCIPPSGLNFPRLPMHMLGLRLDGKTARNTASTAETMTQGQLVAMTNRCALVPKNTLSHWRLASGSMTMAAVYITGPSQSTLELLTQGSQQPVLLHDAFLVALARQLLRVEVEHGSTPPGYPQLLIDLFIAHLEWLACVQRASAERRSTLSDPAIIKALSLIDENLDMPITNESLCDSVKVTGALFRRRFKDVTGMPVHRYILKQRVQRARDLIEDTNMALSVIAAHCGFSSQSHMTSAFKRELGLTPGVQRRG